MRNRPALNRRGTVRVSVWARRHSAHRRAVQDPLEKRGGGPTHPFTLVPFPSLQPLTRPSVRYDLMVWAGSVVHGGHPFGVHTPLHTQYLPIPRTMRIHPSLP